MQESEYVKLEDPSYLASTGPPVPTKDGQGRPWVTQQGTVATPKFRVSGVSRPPGSLISDKGSSYVGGNDSELKESIATATGATTKKDVGGPVPFGSLFGGPKLPSTETLLLGGALIAAAIFFGRRNSQPQVAEPSL